MLMVQIEEALASVIDTYPAEHFRSNTILLYPHHHYHHPRTPVMLLMVLLLIVKQHCNSPKADSFRKHPHPTPPYRRIPAYLSLLGRVSDA
jgi:hypothetical protein